MNICVNMYMCIYIYIYMYINIYIYIYIYIRRPLKGVYRRVRLSPPSVVSPTGSILRVKPSPPGHFCPGSPEQVIPLETSFKSYLWNSSWPVCTVSWPLCTVS